MKVYLTDQQKRFNKHLDILKTKAVMDYDKKNLVEQISTIVVNTNKRLKQLYLTFLFNYQIFPENIMTFRTQWEAENRSLNVGDTIVQQVYVPPNKIFSQKMVFGVRISEVVNQSNKKGFSYETLEGHVEKGISTFTIEQLESKLVFKIHTYSTPGNFLTKLLGPVFSTPYQAFCTKAALINVKKQLEQLQK